MLVGGIEIGCADNEHRHLPACPVFHAGWDQNRGLRRDRMPLPIKLDRGALVALNDHVNFGVILVIVVAGITADVGEVDRPRELIPIGKCTAGNAAGALHGGQASQIDDGRFSGHANK